MRVVNQSHEVLTIIDGIEMLKSIEVAGRTCYKSESKIAEDSAVGFVEMILRRGHESVIEHVSISVRFITDRGVTHELVRHRLAAYSQESTRYCDYKDGEIEFVKPVDVTGAHLGKWESAMHHAEYYYKLLREEGMRPELARSVLPNSLKTEIVMTANAREWRHVLNLRTSRAAHPQMRALMNPLLTELRERVPVLFDSVG